MASPLQLPCPWGHGIDCHRVDLCLPSTAGNIEIVLLPPGGLEWQREQAAFVWWVPSPGENWHNRETVGLSCLQPARAQCNRPQLQQCSTAGLKSNVRLSLSAPTKFQQCRWQSGEGAVPGACGRTLLRVLPQSCVHPLLPYSHACARARTHTHTHTHNI